MEVLALRKPRMLPILITALSAMLVFAMACGSSDSDDGDGDSPTATATSRSNNENQGSSNTDLDPDTGVVTIGSKTYEFNMTSPVVDTCLTLFGVVGGGGTAADGSDISVNMEFPPEDWRSDPDLAELDPPSIRIDDDTTNEDWRSGGDIVRQDDRIPDGASQIDSYTNDGNVAKGTASFIDYRAFSGGVPPASVQGTFEFYCG